ncbi:uncharacterized protein EV422DRAFT_227614 [Fimicolochytrium jonesii]|uniref:uncharacterized protein n=1 Tax=Fimicolochytrium jonesii TaxID=1396493 RepID=UPI0022FE4BA3|nr:uncharacterized protein EV422DRAFT_227614 [Fimicolochytrium jonesii]KAI8817233.1 hypothetical protein EV422DRAFT_227614 [Fimicolochytrium jonesii]
MARIFSILAVLFAFAALSTAAPTTSPACIVQTPSVNQSTCNWYTDCAEPIFQCGSKGYPVGYGYFYCSKFAEVVPKMSEKGQTWLLGVMQCLQSALSLKLTTPLSCPSVRSYAFGTHPTCYTSGQVSFCELGVPDLLHLAPVFQERPWDLITIESQKQIATVLGTCGKQFAEKIKGIFHLPHLA